LKELRVLDALEHPLPLAVKTPVAVKVSVKEGKDLELGTSGETAALIEVVRLK
jgi:hypothetical protein